MLFGLLCACLVGCFVCGGLGVTLVVGGDTLIMVFSVVWDVVCFIICSIIYCWLSCLNVLFDFVWFRLVVCLVLVLFCCYLFVCWCCLFASG